MTIEAQIPLEFIRFAVDSEVLKFGNFLTKAGRNSPYFFNAGLFNTGRKIQRLAEFYAKTLISSNIEYDMLFGPAYKGIPLVTAISMQLDSIQQKETPFSYNRKEAKDHGEGGNLVGAPLAGRVVILDDVISAGTSIRESVEIIEKSGAKPAGVLIALDRQEKTGKNGTLSELSAVESVEKEFGIPVVSIGNLTSILDFIKNSQDFESYYAAIMEYRTKYGTES